MRLKKKWKRVLLVGFILLVNKSNYSQETVINYERKEIIGVKEIAQPEYLNYRMTYYYTGDATFSTDITASGIKTGEFKVNEYGWYTYKGKLVVATASKRLLSWEKYKNSTQKTFNLYDELKIEIKGKVYDAIVLDVCGAAMLEPKIDLFVKNKASGYDGQVKVFVDNN